MRGTITRHYYISWAAHIEHTLHKDNTCFSIAEVLFVVNRHPQKVAPSSDDAAVSTEWEPGSSWPHTASPDGRGWFPLHTGVPPHTASCCRPLGTECRTSLHYYPSACLLRAVFVQWDVTGSCSLLGCSWHLLQASSRHCCTVLLGRSSLLSVCWLWEANFSVSKSHGFQVTLMVQEEKRKQQRSKWTLVHSCNLRKMAERNFSF